MRNFHFQIFVGTIVLIGFVFYLIFYKNSSSSSFRISTDTCETQSQLLGKSISKLQIRNKNTIIRFGAIADFGKSNVCEMAVAELVKKFNPDFVVTAGDNNYSGPRKFDESIGKYYHEYIGNYIGTFGTGSKTNRFFPSIGNHDDVDGDISAYLNFFTLPGIGNNTSENERYYDFVIGPVHFFALNSTTETEPDGISKTSQQALWLKNQLSNSKAQWKIVYFHHAPFSSSKKHGSNRDMQWEFEDWGASAVISGHVHAYERIMRDDNNDGVDLPYFTIGLGGVRTLYKFKENNFVDGSMVRYNSAHGALFVDVVENSLIFGFYSIENGGTLVDRLEISKSIHLR